MAVNKNTITDADAQRAVALALEDFYTALLKKIDEVQIRDIMKRKNPYLYRAKAMQNAAEIVESVLSATVSSSEETIFGNCFFEPLAIFASGGAKALAPGVDIMAEDRDANTVYGIAVKSGPSIYNSSSRSKQDQNFIAAAKLAAQAHAHFTPVIGYSYGKKKPSRKSSSFCTELAGQRFWEYLTGDPHFYLKIISYMGTKPEQYVERFREAYDRASNRLVGQFIADFCNPDGSIDWDRLVRFNSSYED